MLPLLFIFKCVSSLHKHLEVALLEQEQPAFETDSSTIEQSHLTQFCTLFEMWYCLFYKQTKQTKQTFVADPLTSVVALPLAMLPLDSDITRRGAT